MIIETEEDANVAQEALNAFHQQKELEIKLANQAILAPFIEYGLGTNTINIEDVSGFIKALKENSIPLSVLNPTLFNLANSVATVLESFNSSIRNLIEQNKVPQNDSDPVS